MKKFLAIAMATAMLVLATACGGSTTSTSSTSGSTSTAPEAKPFEGQTLTISTFSFNAELLQKNIYEPFEAATGAKVVVDPGRNSERVTKIMESPENYDVVVIGDMFVAQLAEAGVIQSFDRSLLTNLDALYPGAVAPMGEEFGPAYTFNRLGIVYDKAYTAIEINSWADLWKPELSGSISVPDITTTSGILFYYATAEAFGLEVGKDDAAIFDKLAELKPNIVKTYTSANDTITMLNQGEISVAVLLDYSYTSAKSANPDYVWVEPTEGSFSGYNMLNIVAGSKNVELATAFIDFYLSYDVQLAEALDGVDSPVRTDVELTEEQAANFTYGEETINALHFPDWSIINANKAEWIEKWNTIFSIQ